MNRFLCVLALVIGGTALFAESTAAPLMKTLGPKGEEPTFYDAVNVGSQDVSLIKAKHLKAAILMHTSSDFTNALVTGAKQEFARLGIEVVTVTDAEMDSNKQRTDIETALALKPNILITLVLDPVSGAVALRKAVDQGVKVVLISNLPAGFVHGKDYAGIVTDDLFGMGKSVAEMMGSSLAGSGNVALLYHDANFYVTNQRDKAVKTVLASQYPGIKVIAEKGIANPADGEAIASAIIAQNPTVKAIYAPWDTIAEGVVAATRAANRKDIKVFTMDLGANNGLDMVKGGNIAGVVADLPFTMGETLARMGALSALGQKTPPFVVVPAVKVIKENIQVMWKKSLNRDAPKEILNALK